MTWADTARRSTPKQFDFSRFPDAGTFVRAAFERAGIPFPEATPSAGYSGAGRVAAALADQGIEQPRISIESLIDRCKVYSGAVVADALGAIESPRLLAGHAHPIRQVYYGLSPHNDASEAGFRRMNHEVDRVLDALEDVVREAVRGCEVQPVRSCGA